MRNNRPGSYLVAGGALVLCVGVALWSMYDKGQPSVVSGGARGVANHSTSTEAGKPLLRAGGELYKYKSGAFREEVEKAEEGAFQALFEKVLNVEAGPQQSAMAQTLVDRWIKADITGLRDFISEWEMDSDRSERMWNVLAPAMRTLLPALTAKRETTAELSDFLEKVVELEAERDLESAMAWCRNSLTGYARDSALAKLAGGKARLGGKEAVSLLEEISAPNRKLQAVLSIAKGRAAVAPEEAMNWAQQIPDEHSRTVAMEQVIHTLARSNLERAAHEMREYVQSIFVPTPPSDSDGLSEHDDAPPVQNTDRMAGLAGMIAEALAAKDPAKALEWADSLPDERLSDTAYGRVFRGWARKDPKEALQYVQQNHKDVHFMVGPIFREWAALDLSNASATALTFEDPNLRIHALTGLARGLTERGAGLSNIATWTASLPEGPERDSVIVEVVGHARHDDPMFSWEQAKLIRDQNVQARVLTDVFPELIATNLEAALKVLKQSGLTAATRQKLAEIAERAGVGAELN